MKTSEEGIQFIMDCEGFRGRMYYDAAGHPTIGYGHTKITSKDTVTKEEAKQLLIEDIGRFEMDLNRLKLDINQKQFDALISFTFNLGFTRLLHSNIVRFIDEEKWKLVAEEIKKYDHALVSGEMVVLKGLTKRREHEAKAFF